MSAVKSEEYCGKDTEWWMIARKSGERIPNTSIEKVSFYKCPGVWSHRQRLFPDELVYVAPMIYKPIHILVALIHKREQSA